MTEHKHEKLDYVEFMSSDLAASKRFFSAAFGWQFQDYGTQYSAFSHEGLEGGFYPGQLACSTETGAPLLVFYSENLENSLDKVRQAGANIVKDIFDFPGGRRFHFVEPGGNELAVWSDKR